MGEEKSVLLTQEAFDTLKDEVATKYDVISPESPIGAAILGANEGDTVSYKAPNGREISVVIKEAKPLS